MVREVEVLLPRVGGVGSGVVRAIAFQDLPGRAVGTYNAVDPELQGTVGMGLLALAVGSGVDLDIYSYSELMLMVDRWRERSMELEALEEEVGWTVGSEVDWSQLL